MPRLIGAKRFNELYLFSANVNMTEALALGLVNFVCDENEIDAKLSEIVKNLLILPMETITRFKNLVNNSMFSGLKPSGHGTTIREGAWRTTSF